MEKNTLKKIVRKFPATIKHLIHYLLEPKFRKYNNPVRLPKIFVRVMAPNVAYYIYWVFFPLYLVLKSRNIYFLANNISNSPGQIVPELDNLLRNNLSRVGGNQIAVWPKSEVALGAKIAYGKFFKMVVVSDILYAFILPLLIRYPAITVDSANSLVDISLKASKKKYILGIPLFIMGQREFEEAWLIAAKYNEMKGRQKGYLPMKNIYSKKYENTSNTLDLIIKTKNYALVQIKDIAGNGTALPIDPISYIKSIEYLQSLGLNIVFAGREKMPNIFKDYGVINYSEDIRNNFYMDLILVKNAKIVLSSASGFGNLPGSMDIPLVYANQWNFICPAPGRYTILVPSLFITEKKIWPFLRQIKYFYERKDSNTKISNEIGVINATGEDILAGVKEALSLKNFFTKESAMQKKFRKMTQGTPYHHIDSRISSSFIEKYSQLLDD